jgi:hypothetical protein
VETKKDGNTGWKAKRHRSATIGLFAPVGLVGYGDMATAQAPYTIRYGVDTERNINTLSQVIAERQGFLAREGITLDPVRFLTGTVRSSNRYAMVAARENIDMTLGKPRS